MSENEQAAYDALVQELADNRFQWLVVGWSGKVSDIICNDKHPKLRKLAHDDSYSAAIFSISVNRPGTAYAEGDSPRSALNNAYESFLFRPLEVLSE